VWSIRFFSVPVCFLRSLLTRGIASRRKSMAPNPHIDACAQFLGTGCSVISLSRTDHSRVNV